MSKIAIWLAGRGGWANYPDDEIIWLDRTLLSDGRDQSLHRSPRCPALRYVHHRWELFSRDVTHDVFVAPFASGDRLSCREVAATASHVVARARPGLESTPVRLAAGNWVICVGCWILPVCIEQIPGDDGSQTTPHDSDLGATSDVDPSEVPNVHPPAADAVSSVTRYFERNPMACLAMAYYFRAFILGEPTPQTAPMLEVVVALDLSSEGAVSEYKKELQRRIWREQGHQRELGHFLLTNGLIGALELNRAVQLAADNEATGRTDATRARLRYKVKRAT
jgi:hypothetical protein